MLAQGITAVKKNALSGNHWGSPPSADSGIKIQEIQFMKCNSVIRIQES